jgi:hypothetical protein
MPGPTQRRPARLTGGVAIHRRVAPTRTDEGSARRPAIPPAFCRHSHRFENCSICMREYEREVLPAR